MRYLAVCEGIHGFQADVVDAVDKKAALKKLTQSERHLGIRVTLVEIKDTFEIDKRPDAPLRYGIILDRAGEKVAYLIETGNLDAPDLWLEENIEEDVSSFIAVQIFRDDL